MTSPMSKILNSSHFKVKAMEEISSEFCQIFAQGDEAVRFKSFFSSDLCDKLTPHVIFSVDSNVKNLLWNSRTTDAKGVKLEELILDNNLSIVNTSLSELNFVPKKTSFLDLTLMRDKVSIARWFYPDIPSFSDHPYIYFEVVPSTKDM